MKILRLTEVIEKTGLSKSAIYRGLDENTFPQPVQLTERAVGWLESDLDKWIKKLVRQNAN